MVNKVLVAGYCLINSSVVFAANKVNSSHSSTREMAKTISYNDVLNWSVSLLIVLAVLFFCAWLMRKSGYLSAAGKNNLSVLAGLSLGMREKVVLIKVGDKQLLLGVTPGRVDKLLELEGEEKLFQEQNNQATSEFSKKLLQVMKGRAGE